MTDYLRYYLSPLTLMVAVFGLVMGGSYVWLGLATLPALALGDAVLPRDLSERRITNHSLAIVPVILSSALAFVTFCLLSWRVGEGGFSPVNLVGAIVSTGWIATVVGIPAFHELFHRRSAFLRKLGLCLQVMYGDATRDIAHVVGHHIDVGTANDSDTARRGQSLYLFAAEAMTHSFMTSHRMESDALEKRGKHRWSIRHRLWRAIAGSAIFLGLMAMIGGWAGMLACFVTTMIARFLLESFNYFQHYGQIRVPGTPIEKRHVWNHFGALSRAMTFEITNHSGHHLNAFAPYHELKPDRQAVMLPSVFICFISALVPPVWHRFVIMPALKQWDLTQASFAERELAREQNIAARWPDWFSE